MRVRKMLDENPAAILNIIMNHPYIGGSFLLDDLADKMKKQHREDDLGLLFYHFAEEIVTRCVFNPYDLKRVCNAAPGYAEKLIAYSQQTRPKPR